MRWLIRICDDPQHLQGAGDSLKTHRNGSTCFTCIQQAFQVDALCEIIVSATSKTLQGSVEPLPDSLKTPQTAQSRFAAAADYFHGYKSILKWRHQSIKYLLKWMLELPANVKRIIPRLPSSTSKVWMSEFSSADV